MFLTATLTKSINEGAFVSVTHIYQGQGVLLHLLPFPNSEVRIIGQSGSSRQAIVKISTLFEIKYSEKLHPTRGTTFRIVIPGL